MKYFWHYSPDTTPKPVVDPRDLRPSDRLCVAATQTGLSSAQQKVLVKQWCDLLPTLGDVRRLWLSSKVPQALFEAACRMPALEGLWIKWSAIDSIASIANLPHLRYFHLGSSTRLTSLDPLAGQTGLKWLGLENLRKIRDLDPLAALADLEGLTLCGSMYLGMDRCDACADPPVARTSLSLARQLARRGSDVEPAAWPAESRNADHGPMVGR